MKERVAAFFEMLPPGMFLAMAIFSAVVFVGSLLAIPFILVRLPVDYFDVRVPRSWMKGRHPAIRTISRIVQNVFGFLFFLAGVSMLVLPGQGVLTILIGISLMDFPGKRRLEAWIIGRPLVLNAVNSLRARFGKPPFVLAQDS